MKLTAGNTRGRATGLDNVDGSFVNNPYCVSQAEYLTGPPEFSRSEGEARKVRLARNQV